MKRLEITLLALLLGGFACSDPEQAALPPLLDDVDPFIGSGGVGFGVGSIPPGPARPLSLARPGPDTATNGGRAPSFSHCAGYWWQDDEILAFSQIHLVGTGVPDQGTLGIMPTGELPAGPLRPRDWRADFSHRREIARPGYYSVELAPSAIGVDISATERTSVYRLRYPKDSPRNLVIDLAHHLGDGRTDDGLLTANADGTEVGGWVHHSGMLSGRYGGYRLFFVLKTDTPFTGMDAMQDGLRLANVRTATGAQAGAVLSFGPGAAPIHLQIGLSFVDAAGARKNLESEWVNYDLDAAEAGTRAAWSTILDRVSIKGGTDAQRRIFSTALFHAYGMPTVLSDADGRYVGVDTQVAQADGWNYYTDFSLWDTFRTQHPLITLLTPSIQRDMNRSMWAMTEASGRIPMWPLATGETNTMIAYHGESVLVDSVLKGVEGFDVAAAYEVLKQSALRNGSVPTGRARDCSASYLELGYCPMDVEGGATSKTLEAAFSDFVLARLAAHLGHDVDAAMFMDRSENWKQLWDAESGLLRGRMADGSFPEAYRDDRFSEDLIEGNLRQWAVFVPHDVPGWAESFGGTAAAVQWLDNFFAQSEPLEDTPLPDLWYWHGNEPDIHAPFMFAELGRPDLTNKWAAWVRQAKYRDRPDGLDGNDDGGTLSAWYVFSALGLFPKVGEARYVLASPLFEEATVRLDGGVLNIRTENWREGATDVAAVLFDDEPVVGPFISHERIQAGGTLLFRMK